MFDDNVFKELVDLLLLFKQVFQFAVIVGTDVGKLLVETC